MNYRRISRTFQNIRFEIAIPEYPTYRDRSFRLLISQHGTREQDSQIGADDYIEYPLEYDDPFLYDLVVVAPHFPASDITPTSPNGKDFQRFNGAGLQWLYDLVHIELPRIFAEREVNVRVETDRFYFFGHSRGGMAVHTYIMRFNGEDIFRATSCGGRLVQRDDSRYAGLSDNEYLIRLDAFLSTNVASVLGTAESASRIESVRSFICREVSQRVSSSQVSLVSPIPPVTLAEQARLTCDLFSDPTIAPRNQPLSNMGYRFLWNEGANHRGYKNYRVARTFLFQDRKRKPTYWLIWKYPVLVLRYWLSMPRVNRLARLKAELEERLDQEDINEHPETQTKG